MANIALEKPGLAVTPIVAGGDVGRAGLDTNKFVIKVMRGQLGYRSPEAEATGDGDNVPVWRNNCLLYGQFNLLGGMVSITTGPTFGAGIGNLARTVATTNNPVTLTLNIGPDRALTGTALISALRFRWNRRNPWVGLALQGRWTDSHPTETTASAGTGQDLTDLEKPGTADGQVLSSGLMGTGGTDFYIKVMDGTWTFISPEAESTGDGDSAPVYENNGMLYGSCSLTGGMIAAQAAGLASLIDTTKNPVADVIFELGPDQALDGTILIAGVNFNWDRKGPWVGLAMQGRYTDETPTEIAAP